MNVEDEYGQNLLVSLAIAQEFLFQIFIFLLVIKAIKILSNFSIQDQLISFVNKLIKCTSLRFITFKFIFFQALSQSFWTHLRKGTITLLGNLKHFKLSTKTMELRKR